MSNEPYARNLAVGWANQDTIELVKQAKPTNYAEIGVYKGHTAVEVAKHLPAGATMHLFDFDDMLPDVVAKITKVATNIEVKKYPCERKLMNSYCWPLGELLLKEDPPKFDYVFLDGAHTWNVDALAFLIVDRLLEVGGVVDFDDYWWTLATSPSMNPKKFTDTEKWYTPRQINQPHVKMIVEALVRKDDRYEEIKKNKAFRKVSS